MIVETKLPWLEWSACFKLLQCVYICSKLVLLGGFPPWFQNQPNIVWENKTHSKQLVVASGLRLQKKYILTNRKPTSIPVSCILKVQELSFQVGMKHMGTALARAQGCCHEMLPKRRSQSSKAT